jgi:hypothetical protein
MKKVLFKIFGCLFLIVFLVEQVNAQCSVCTKTAQQLGANAGGGLNAGILYLAAFPFGIVGFIAFRWWKMKSVKE